MKLQKIAALSAALLVATSVAGAQGQPVTKDAPPQGGPGRGGMMMSAKALLKDITLTADQQKSFDAIDAKYQPQVEKMMADMRAAREAGNMDRDAMQANREKMTKLTDEENAEIRKILTAEQQAVFDKNVEERKAQRGRGRPGGPGSGR